MKIKAVVFENFDQLITTRQRNSWDWFIDRKIALYVIGGSILPEDTPIQKINDYQTLERILHEKTIHPHQVFFIYSSREGIISASQKHFYTFPFYDLDRIARAINQIEYTRSH